MLKENLRHTSNVLLLRGSGGGDEIQRRIWEQKIILRRYICVSASPFSLAKNVGFRHVLHGLLAIFAPFSFRPKLSSIFYQYTRSVAALCGTLCKLLARAELAIICVLTRKMQTCKQCCIYRISMCTNAHEVESNAPLACSSYPTNTRLFCALAMSNMLNALLSSSLT